MSTPSANPPPDPDDRHDETIVNAPLSKSGVQRPAYVTELKSLEQQVGEHIVQALRHDDAAAVLTFVQPDDDGRQRMISMPVALTTLQSFQELLAREEEPAAREVPCIGFHCVVEQREKDARLRARNDPTQTPGEDTAND